VHSLHRTRGRFGNEATDSAVIVPGPVARLVPIAVGGLLLFATGMVAAKAASMPRGARNRGGRPPDSLTTA